MLGNWVGLDFCHASEAHDDTYSWWNHGSWHYDGWQVIWSCERIREAWQVGVVELGSASHLRHMIRTPRPGHLRGGGPPMASRSAGQVDDVFIDVWQSSVYDKFDLSCISGLS